MRNSLAGLGEKMSPHEMPSDRLAEIAEIIGCEMTIRLCENFAGVPNTLSRKELNALKREYVRRCGEGKSPRELAIQLDLTERHVHRLYAEPVQTSLFDE